MGSVWQERGRIFMQRCPNCLKTNFTACINLGRCAHCRYVATIADVDRVEHIPGALPGNRKTRFPIDRQQLLRAVRIRNLTFVAVSHKFKKSSHYFSQLTKDGLMSKDNFKKLVGMLNLNSKEIQAIAGKNYEM